MVLENEEILLPKNKQSFETVSFLLTAMSRQADCPKVARSQFIFREKTSLIFLLKKESQKQKRVY